MGRGEGEGMSRALGLRGAGAHGAAEVPEEGVVRGEAGAGVEGGLATVRVRVMEAVGLGKGDCYVQAQLTRPRSHREGQRGAGADAVPREVVHPRQKGRTHTVRVGRATKGRARWDADGATFTLAMDEEGQALVVTAKRSKGCGVNAVLGHATVDLTGISSGRDRAAGKPEVQVGWHPLLPGRGAKKGGKGVVESADASPAAKVGDIRLSIEVFHVRLADVTATIESVAVPAGSGPAYVSMILGGGGGAAAPQNTSAFSLGDGTQPIAEVSPQLAGLRLTVRSVEELIEGAMMSVVSSSDGRSLGNCRVPLVQLCGAGGGDRTAHTSLALVNAAGEPVGGGVRVKLHMTPTKLGAGPLAKVPQVIIRLGLLRISALTQLDGEEVESALLEATSFEEDFMCAVTVPPGVRRLAVRAWPFDRHAQAVRVRWGESLNEADITAANPRVTIDVPPGSSAFEVQVVAQDGRLGSYIVSCESGIKEESPSQDSPAPLTLDRIAPEEKIAEVEAPAETPTKEAEEEPDTTSNLFLASLHLGPPGVKLVPEFSPEILHYTVTVPHAIKTLQVRAVPSFPVQSIGLLLGDREEWMDGSARRAFPTLNIVEGLNLTQIVVEEGGRQGVYTLDVRRRDAPIVGLELSTRGGDAVALDPPFDSGVFEYAATISGGDPAVYARLTPGANCSAFPLVRLDGSDVGSALFGQEGPMKPMRIPLHPGTNELEFVVPLVQGDEEQEVVDVPVHQVPVEEATESEGSASTGSSAADELTVPRLIERYEAMFGKLPSAAQDAEAPQEGLQIITGPVQTYTVRVSIRPSPVSVFPEDESEEEVEKARTPRLQGMLVSDAELTPAFEAGRSIYSTRVQHWIDTMPLTLRPTPGSEVSVELEGDLGPVRSPWLEEEESSFRVPVKVGENAVRVWVRDTATRAESSYWITASRSPPLKLDALEITQHDIQQSPHNEVLHALVAMHGESMRAELEKVHGYGEEGAPAWTWPPTFDPECCHYLVTVPHEVQSVRIRANAHPSLDIVGDGLHKLHEGTNRLRVTVGAEGQVESPVDYLIEVVREPDVHSPEVKDRPSPALARLSIEFLTLTTRPGLDHGQAGGMPPSAQGELTHPKGRTTGTTITEEPRQRKGYDATSSLYDTCAPSITFSDPIPFVTNTVPFGEADAVIVSAEALLPETSKVSINGIGGEGFSIRGPYHLGLGPNVLTVEVVTEGCAIPHAYSLRLLKGECKGEIIRPSSLPSEKTGRQWRPLVGGTLLVMGMHLTSRRRVS